MNCRRKGIFLPPPPQVCCLSEHSGMLEFTFLHTRRPTAENEVKSTNAGPNSVKWHQLPFCCSAWRGRSAKQVPSPDAVLQTFVSGPASWEQPLDTAAKGKNPEPGQMAQRSSTSEERGAGDSLPGCLHPSLPALSNLKRFSCIGFIKNKQTNKPLNCNSKQH